MTFPYDGEKNSGRFGGWHVKKKKHTAAKIQPANMREVAFLQTGQRYNTGAALNAASTAAKKIRMSMTTKL